MNKRLKCFDSVFGRDNRSPKGLNELQYQERFCSPVHKMIGEQQCLRYQRDPLHKRKCVPCEHRVYDTDGLIKSKKKKRKG